MLGLDEYISIAMTARDKLFELERIRSNSRIWEPGKKSLKVSWIEREMLKCFQAIYNSKRAFKTFTLGHLSCPMKSRQRMVVKRFSRPEQHVQGECFLQVYELPSFQK